MTSCLWWWQSPAASVSCGCQRSTEWLTLRTVSAELDVHLTEHRVHVLGGFLFMSLRSLSQNMVITTSAPPTDHTWRIWGQCTNSSTVRTLCLYSRITMCVHQNNNACTSESQCVYIRITSVHQKDTCYQCSFVVRFLSCLICCQSSCPFRLDFTIPTWWIFYLWRMQFSTLILALVCESCMSHPLS